MRASRIALVAFVASFVVAEAMHATHVTEPKRTVAKGLVLRSQDEFDGASRSLDPELLDDLPRIHPDALGAIETTRNPNGATVSLRGWIADPYTHAAGIAVFPIVDGRRIPDAKTTYGMSRPAVAARYGARAEPTGFRIDLPRGEVARGTRLAIGLIAFDQRGYFLLGADVPDAPPTEPAR